MNELIPYPRDYFDGPYHHDELTTDDILDYLEFERTKLIDGTESDLVDYLTSESFDSALEKFALSYISSDLTELLTKSTVRAALDLLGGKGSLYSYLGVFSSGGLTEGELFNYMNIKAYEYKDLIK